MVLRFDQDDLLSVSRHVRGALRPTRRRYRRTQNGLEGSLIRQRLMTLFRVFRSATRVNRESRVLNTTSSVSSRSAQRSRQQGIGDNNRFSILRSR